MFADHRIRDGISSQVNARHLAFLDQGRPRYLMKPVGSAYDLVGRRWTALKTGVEFQNIRKSTNELLTSLVETIKDPEQRSILTEVLQKRFLGQKTPELIRLYRTIGRGAYEQMNSYLPKVGDHLRAHDVFEHLKY